ncbi:MAG: LysR family transcriptional regulator [Gammaproteobacteria bacterium]|nr:LysR family transcriptional regulator [Gammaproteobacteria bacterium]
MTDSAPHWDDLRMFLAVARAESLSTAGTRLKKDPATISRRMQRLEGNLGVRLFNRSPQGYLLTEPGQRLLQHAEAMEQSFINAEQAVADSPDQLRGSIRIGAPDGCASFLLPQVVEQICRENPELEVQIVSLPRIFNLSKREADMAIAVSRPQTGRLIVQPLTDYQLYIAVAKDWIAVNGEPHTLEHLKQHRFVGYIPDMIFDSELDYLSEIGIDPPRLSSNSVVVQLNWARQGAGPAIVHDFALPFAPELVPILRDAISLQRTFYLIRHVDDRQVNRLNRFARLLVDGVRTEAARLAKQVAQAYPLTL